MMHAALTLASTAETSQTPFYVGGAVLAAFAVLVGALGIVKHDFPASKGARNLVMLICTALVAVAMATAVLTS
jgi:hypothetical protein